MESSVPAEGTAGQGVKTRSRGCVSTHRDDFPRILPNETTARGVEPGMRRVAPLLVVLLAAQAPQPPTRVLDDPSIQHGPVTFPSGDGEIDGYLARPKAPGKFPAVLVV